MRERGVSVEEVLRFALGLPEVTEREFTNWISIKVRGKGFGYVSEPDRVVMLKATREEQAALVGEDPEVFQLSLTSGRFGWVLVQLPLVFRDELEELVTEAWYHSAPKRLIAAYEKGDAMRT